MIIIEFLRYIIGFVKFKSFGGFSERFLDLCNSEDIPLWNIKNQNGEITAFTSVNGYKRIRKISKNKFDSDMKDTIITYYSLIYLKKLFSNSQFMNMLQSTVNCAVIDSKNVTLKNISSVIT